MASPLIALRVFLATPGCLDLERQIFRDAVLHFNEDFGHEMGFVLVPVGWEQVPAAACRPQSLINDRVRAADYLVVLMWKRWGTATSEDSKFSSGTEEELSVALECLGDPNREMRNVAVFFKEVEKSLDDPGPQLARVLQFKVALETHRALFFKTFDTTDKLRRQLQNLFMSWLRDFEEDKRPIEIEMPDLNEDLSVQKVGGAGSDTVPELLARAREWENRGLVTQAELAYVAAISSDDIESLMSYARFLRRTGRLEGAFRINERILGLKDFLAAPSHSSAADRSYVLANMGLIRRKQDALGDSRSLLEEAVRTASMRPDAGGLASQAYALDNLGLTLRRQGKVQDALVCHETSLRLRQQLGDDGGRAKSLINISRLRKDDNKLEVARALAEEAIEILTELDDEQPTLANAYSTLGDIVRSAGDLPGALKSYERALSLNKELSHADGIAIASGQLARLHLHFGRTDEALLHAELCRDENVRSGNEEGEAFALQILGEVKRATGEV